MAHDGTFEWDEVAWRLDTEKLSPEARGIYREILGALYLTDRSGVITGTREELARSGRCSAVQVNGAIEEIEKYRVANVSERNGIVTIVNRRMKRDHEKRKKACIRVQKSRSNGGSNVPENRPKRKRNTHCNAAVTLPLISSDKDSEKALSKTLLEPLKKGGLGENKPGNAPVTPKKRLTEPQRNLARRFEIILGHQWINDAGKWVNRIKEVDQYGNTTPGTFSKTERVLAEVESATKENRVRETPAQYAEQIWKEFKGEYPLTIL